MREFSPPCTRHLHFTVFAFEIDSVLSTPSANGDYEDYADLHGRPERVPLFCTAAGLRLVGTGEDRDELCCLLLNCFCELAAYFCCWRKDKPLTRLSLQQLRPQIRRAGVGRPPPRARRQDAQQGPQ